MGRVGKTLKKACNRFIINYYRITSDNTLSNQFIQPTQKTCAADLNVLPFKHAP
jgi:hypothetical protein